MTPMTSGPGETDQLPVEHQDQSQEQASPSASTEPEDLQADGPNEMGFPGEWCICAVTGVELQLPSQYPEVLLTEVAMPYRELRIPVGLAEGTAIAYAFYGHPTPRPLTHAFMSDLLEQHDVTISALRVTAFRNGLFFAELDTFGAKGRRVVPCRPSDGIALVLRGKLPVPILVGDWVLSPPAP